MPRWSVVSTLLRHELRSALRERTIVVHSIVIPLFLYPLMIWAIYSGLAFVQVQNEGFTSRVALVESAGPASLAALRFRLGSGRLKLVEAADPAHALADGRLDA